MIAVSIQNTGYDNAGIQSRLAYPVFKMRMSGFVVMINGIMWLGKLERLNTLN